MTWKNDQNMQKYTSFKPMQETGSAQRTLRCLEQLFLVDKCFFFLFQIIFSTVQGLVASQDDSKETHDYFTV